MTKKKLNISGWPFFLCLIFSSCMKNVGNESADSRDITFTKKIDNYINAHVANSRFNGNLFIAKGDSIIYSKSFGLADRELGKSNTPLTKFLIGSITKPFTAYGILILENRNLLSLEDKLAHYFPEFPDAQKVTINHMLNHRSGIRDYHTFVDWKEKSKLSPTPQSTILDVAQDPFVFEPGEQFSYSNTNYILLGLIIEQVYGQPYNVFIEKEINELLDLNRTGVKLNDSIVIELASGYITSPREVKKADYINFNQPYASGNMYSTTADLWKFTRAVMNNPLLPYQKNSKINDSSGLYSSGWGIRNYNGVIAYGHHGGMNGFVGSITYIPNGEYFVGFLTNDENTPKYTISEDLMKIVLGEVVKPPKKVQLVNLSDEMIKSVSGNYLVKPGDTLSVFQDSAQLFLKETGQEAHELFPVDSFEYAFTFLEFQAAFSERINGQPQILEFVGKSNVKAKRINNFNNN